MSQQTKNIPSSVIVCDICDEVMYKVGEKMDAEEHKKNYWNNSEYDAHNRCIVTLISLKELEI